MSNSDAENLAMAKAIGEIQGTLKSLMQQTQNNNNAMMQQMQANNDSTNQRITDLTISMDKQTDATNRRIEDHDRANTQRFGAIETRLNAHQDVIESRKNDGKKALGTGGAAGAITAVSIELVKIYSGV